MLLLTMVITVASQDFQHVASPPVKLYAVIHKAKQDHQQETEAQQQERVAAIECAASGDIYFTILTTAVQAAT